jgi:long-chain acyl-CoA synthetase
MHPLLDWFEQTCAARPERPAVCDQGLTLDCGNLPAVAAGLAAQIAARTDRPRIGILAPSSAAGAAAIFACWYAGRVPVPLNFLLSPPELARIFRDAELDLVLAASHFAPLVEGAGLKTLLLDAQSLAPGGLRPPAAASGDVAVVLYTSGTEGVPKGVCLSFDNIVQNARACIEHARIVPDQVWLSVLPQFHSFGFTAMTVTPLVLGVTVHYLPRFSPLAVVNTIAGKKVNVFMAVPSMYAALANMKQAAAEALASLTYTISGGEPLPQKVFDAFLRRFGVTLYEGFGMTEASPVVALNTRSDHRPGSVGRPIPGVHVAAADDRGQILAPGQTGELIIRGHCVMLGYHNQPVATAAALRGGALWTGDVGRVDADGYVYITGRAKEMIIVGGDNVFPREVESVLLEHPAVAEAAVIGVRDEVRGELPAAFVIPREGATTTEAELREFCRRRLAGYKVPRWVRIATDLPRSPTGKILKRALNLDR